MWKDNLKIFPTILPIPTGTWLQSKSKHCFFFYFYFVYRFAGTVGAILTCPLEVVKTRLQSSSSTFYPQPMPDVANKLNPNGLRFKKSTQTREICTSILQKRSQVSVQLCNNAIFKFLIIIHFFFHRVFLWQFLTISQCGIASSSQSISIWQCLKWVNNCKQY